MWQVITASCVIFIGIVYMYELSYIFEGLSSQWEFYLEHRRLWFFVGDIILFLCSLVMFLVAMVLVLSGTCLLIGGSL